MFYLGQFTYYAANQDYIIENFCINKNRPEFNCDGKCYLAKQMMAAAQNDGDSINISFILESFFPVFTPPQHLDFNEPEVVLTDRITYSYIEPLFVEGIDRKQLRPPIC